MITAVCAERRNKKHLDENKIPYEDFGTYNTDSVDYPLIAEKTCAAITSGKCDKGILCCGTGIGISMAANKIKGIRAALCSDYFSAKYTRLHNDANVICMGGRTIGPGLALELVDIFLNTPFEGGPSCKTGGTVDEAGGEIGRFRLLGMYYQKCRWGGNGEMNYVKTGHYGSSADSAQTDDYAG